MHIGYPGSQFVPVIAQLTFASSRKMPSPARPAALVLCWRPTLVCGGCAAYVHCAAQLLSLLLLTALLPVRCEHWW